MISEEEKFFITELLKEDIEILEEDYILGKAGKSILAREIKEGLNLIEKQNKEAELKDKIIDIMAEEILKLDRMRASHEYDKPRIWETEEGVEEFFRKKVEE